ncbi:MAG TPA: tyrosine-type recombinase/integrase [Acidimicrobiales bacterium]|nr:tyrosine-type recombinase/integrase [Acidimicrobiales bacterium]
MSALASCAEDYLAVRRALGYLLRQEGRLLVDFVDFVEGHGESTVTIDSALAWATLPVDADPVWWAKRLSVVRGFARHLATIDERTEVPPPGLLANRSHRPTPYLYSQNEVLALMAAARRLPTPLRAATFETLIGLMATTGLRTGEAMRLDRGDVDLAAGVITVVGAKFGKSRLVLLHDSTTVALVRYAARRDECCARPATPSFLLSGAGTRLNHTNASTTFARLIAEAGIAPAGRRRPHLYDFRHSFAVATLVAWHNEGVDVEARLPALSTYLGHVKPSSTYWYLEAAPDLLAVAARRLERFAGEPS